MFRHWQLHNVLYFLWNGVFWVLVWFVRVEWIKKINVRIYKSIACVRHCWKRRADQLHTFFNIFFPCRKPEHRSSIVACTNFLLTPHRSKSYPLSSHNVFMVFCKKFEFSVSDVSGFMTFPLTSLSNMDSDRLIQ